MQANCIKKSRPACSRAYSQRLWMSMHFSNIRYSSNFAEELQCHLTLYAEPKYNHLTFSAAKVLLFFDTCNSYCKKVTKKNLLNDFPSLLDHLP